MPPRSLFERYRPPEHWFFRRDDIGGIHGIDHEARVLIWQELLARLLIKDGMLLDQEALRWAAATHDTQRHADGADIEHGERAAAWVKHRLSHLIPAGTLSLVAYLNTWHVPPDQFAPSPPPELAVFKDADSLDRVRLYDLDPAYLRCAPSQLLTPLAQALFEKSEEKRDQEGYPIFDCVLAAAVDLGLIIVREAEEMGTSTG
ncbi:MAG: hypothetical protein J2P37_09070 [Ktedonobacteraceae bacterium]|nr:hypothetical protein [Ktedonobacteraceae bacterium]MBO0790108.1 hypothetical protein [Ktedonobacteraceae bacterium]